MVTEQEAALQPSKKAAKDNISLSVGPENMAAAGTGENQFENPLQKVSSGERASDEVTNNDGSIIETLDTAFHGEPGFVRDHSIAGSNRADYYEATSQGKSDTEEEQDFIRAQKRMITKF